ncbi:DUF1295 domain-containing protein [candidate division KSB1 bacterium]|nr:DUF1295 domain-containing protein [candidate division KSB1 bacterium]
MPEKVKKSLLPVAWIFYLLVVFEIIYMISPFALYYYSTYGPSLNFLHNWPQTAWLTGFFLPHYTESTWSLLNVLDNIGRIFFLGGLLMFLIGAVQIYKAKFAKKGAVTAGLYRFVRNPQYTAFSIMGLGVLLVWPRFTVLVMYVTMLFIYYFLARKEEKECEEKFGENFRAYVATTPMFIPGNFLTRLPSLPPAGIRRTVAILSIYIAAIAFAVLAAFAIRNLALSSISTSYSQDTATVATTLMSKEEIDKTLQIALKHPQVRHRLELADLGSGKKFLNYIVPLHWYLADLPLEPRPEGAHGHHQPERTNRNEYKILFTKAKITGGMDAIGVDIIKKAYGREPIIVVKLNNATGEVLGLDTPPEHVMWGDIPTPLF